MPGLPGAGLAQSFLPPALFASAMRFDVTIDRNLSLGSWSKCTGLKVDFKNQGVPDGGSNEVVQLAMPPSYGNITLTRAVTMLQAGLVAKWLADQRKKPDKCTAQITLRNAWSLPVMSWSLEGVLPASWSGPEMNATAKSVATETLVISHEGFIASTAGTLVPLPPGASGLMSHASEDTKTQRAKLKGSDGQSLDFAINPNKVSLVCSPKYREVKRSPKSAPKSKLPPKSKGGDLGHGKNEYVGTTPATLTMDFHLNSSMHYRKGVAGELQKLQAWTRPVAGSWPKPVDFTWGKFPAFHGFVERLSIDITLFNSKGAPSRAKVSLVLKEEPAGRSRQNPTSGGVGEHRTHLLVDGETLQSVAHHEYGGAALWRPLAAANGIDDPLRVASGTRLLLPAQL